MKLEVKKIGNSTGLILPKELMNRLNLQQGDWLHVSELPDRTLQITPYDPDHEAALKIARDLFKEYQDTFKALAK
ncbi:AbrB/MazE/SpoVT family DNA-binding domain-containing protein [Oryzibacter oryziterrae]|uniref:AbrB/MazE/SpoVT family DNA-binding domain-containing protein n=1 Tax=Oryzibacter oryziterrae TaxID=2766474 RepID=UPI001F3CB35D|nr:AbrB family transcriptional regulator [Oryzibacter oryziterrae]